MQSAITDIYLSQNANYETIEPNEEYAKFAIKVAALCEEFEKQLSEKQAEEFRKIFDLHIELEAMTNKEHFKEGFKLGLRVAVEACYDK